MLNTMCPDKKYPENLGKQWLEEEDQMLLDELQNNIDIETIAKNHKRTETGIIARRREIVYKMHLEKKLIQIIMKKTNLDYETIRKIISEMVVKKNKEYKNKRVNKPIIECLDDGVEIVSPHLELKEEIIKLKTDVLELKSDIKCLIKMMKAVYEFETA
jgi:predicted transcriptional regulator